jgi:predicted unusual protein kinase regulating ubiquinone biosynthesis (AarF/ABC1/UbiB family)
MRLRRADEEQLRRHAQRHVAERLGRLRGLPQKLGQMLSFSEAADDSGGGAFERLQESAEPLPLDALTGEMESAWNQPLCDVLQEIDPRGYSASLGQVHRATMHDGVEVAIKVQFPGIRENVRTDLKMLGWLSKPLGNLRRGFDLNAYREVILRDMDEELDYQREAQSQRQFADWARQRDDIVVPEVITSLSSDRVLVTRWEEGDTWREVCDHWTPKQKKTLARSLLGVVLEGLFARGMMHADLHPGNLRFRRAQDGSVQIVLYDFGSVFRPTDSQRLGLLRLIRATIERNESPWPLLLKLEFNREYLEPLHAKLPALCRLLFEPFCCEAPYDMDDWRLGERIQDVLGDDRWNFRIAGPAELVFLMRIFHALNFYLKGLDTRINWQHAIRPHLDREIATMTALPVCATDPSDHGFATLAKWFKIRVTENGRTKVELTGNASGIERLEEQLDPSLLVKIKERGIDLKEVVADVRRNGYQPCEVFELDEGAKQIRVWLE